MDLSDHPFSNDNIAYECGAETLGERAWMKWIEKAEALIGHDLDGSDANGRGEGYSFDEAYDQFLGRKTPEAYIATVKSRRRYCRAA